MAKNDVLLFFFELDLLTFLPFLSEPSSSELQETELESDLAPSSFFLSFFSFFLSFFSLSSSFFSSFSSFSSSFSFPFLPAEVVRTPYGHESIWLTLNSPNFSKAALYPSEVVTLSRHSFASVTLRFIV